MSIAKKSASKAPRKARAAAPQKPRGNISKAEIQPLVLEARRAYDRQLCLGNVEPGQKFDDWRRDQVQDAVGRPGLSALDHDHYRPVMAHFATLAGRDDKAIALLFKSGRAKDHGAPEDTYEARERIVSLIRSNLAEHASWDDAGKGHITAGYVLAIARAKAGSQVRSLDGLADRLTTGQLHQLLSTVRNRISTREGRAMPERRGPRRAPKISDLPEADPF